MGWVTIYITGKADFREDVGKKLEDSDLNLMPGYTGASSDIAGFSDLYWVDEKITIRQIKEAIGGKLIWKYRLNFFDTLEAFIESQNTTKNSSEFTPEEKALLNEIATSYYKEAS